MDRIDMLAEKIDAALRDDASGDAVFDMLPAWVAEFEAEHGSTPGTSGGTTALDHYLHETCSGDFDHDHADGMGSGVARLGRAVYRWHDSGMYESRVYATKDAAEAVLDAEAHLWVVAD